ncbi:MAG: hypothetical protein JNK12_15390 [Acidimicrobiales bacterium]|nr:hypothetical protein [Acidimicrobiales bacterium]
MTLLCLVGLALWVVVVVAVLRARVDDRSDAATATTANTAPTTADTEDETADTTFTIPPFGPDLDGFEGDIASITAVPAGARPYGLVADGQAVWVTNNVGGSVTRLDPATGRTVATVDVGDCPERLALGAGAVWVLNACDGTVTRIDASTNEVVTTLLLDAQPQAIAATDDAVWVTTLGAPNLQRIDPATNQFVGGVTIQATLVGVAATDEAVWVTDEADAGRVLRVDPSTEQVVEEVAVGPDPSGVALADDGSVWIVDRGGDTVTAIADGEVVDEYAVEVGGFETGTRSVIATSPGRAWATHSGALVRVDGETGEVASAQICTLEDVNAVAVVGFSVWVTCLDSLGDAGSVQRIDLDGG